jgi:hypothetical protein
MRFAGCMPGDGFSKSEQYAESKPREGGVDSGVRALGFVTTVVRSLLVLGRSLLEVGRGESKSE